MVQEETTIGTVTQGPARAMNNQAWLMLAGVNVPQFFDADTIVLTGGVGIKIKLLYKLFA